MPFPPVFTNVWDTTFPPDTQAANLLGQDLRNVRTDVMQRLSLLSGTLANRPTPETVNATWGGAGFGLLYFATDTAQIFQWNGAVWVNITTTFATTPPLFKSGAAIVHSGDLALDTIYTANVPANLLGTNGVLKGYLRFDTGSNVGSVFVAINFGGVQFFGPSVAKNLGFIVDFRIENRGVTGQQFASFVWYQGFGATQQLTLSNITLLNVDTTVLQTVTVQAQNNSTLGDTTTFNMFNLEII